MKKQPSADVMNVIWGLQALAKKNTEDIYNAQRVLRNVLAEDLSESGESIEAVRKELDDYISDAIWLGEGESIEQRVEETLKKIGYAADRFNNSKEAAHGS
jgi:hypothetical protein